MLRIANIGGLLSLIYIYYNYQTWVISINESNILSSYIVTSMQYMPTRILLIIGILLYVYAIIKSKWSFIMYLTTLALLEILCRISVSTLMLEDTTTFIFLKITVPVAYDLKLFYVQDLLMSIINTKPELLTNRWSLQEFQRFLNETLDLEKINNLNAKQIREYVYELVNEKPNDDIIRNHAFMKAFIFTGMIITLSKLFNLF
jgi:hypothetical protein